MNRDCWIPVDLAPELEPLAEQWQRRSALVAEAEARADAHRAELEAEDEQRRQALDEAHAARDLDAVLALPAPRTEADRSTIVNADRARRVKDAQAALSVLDKMAVDAIREHAAKIKADLAERREQADAERADAERALAEAEARARTARLDASQTARMEDWIDAVCEGRAVLHQRPTRYRIKRPEERVPTLAEIYNRGSTMPTGDPVGVETVREGEDAAGVAIRNGERTKAAIRALEDAGVGSGLTPGQLEAREQRIKEAS